MKNGCLSFLFQSEGEMTTGNENVTSWMGKRRVDGYVNVQVYPLQLNNV